VALSQDGGVHDAVEMGGFTFTSLFGAVDNLRGAVISLELKKHGAVIERGEEEVILINHLGNRNAEAKTNFPRDGPEFFPGLRIESVDAFRVPDDEKLTSLVRDKLGRAVAWLGRGQGAPDLLTGFLVKGDRRASCSAGETDQEVSINEWRGRETPGLGFDSEPLLEVMLPELCAILCGATEKKPLGSQGVDSLLINKGRHSGACGIGHGIGARVGLFPQDLAGRRVEAEEAF